MKESMKRNLNLTALLWDEAYLWAIWLYDALIKSNIGFEIIRAKDLENLDKYKVLFVPGGWARLKLSAITSKRVQLIKDFIKNGGIYFGLCGGAGLATKEGMGLLNIKRKKDRVPGFSGPVKVFLEKHPLWEGIKNSVFYLWWPSEFLINDKNIKVLAKFCSPCFGSFSSDIPVYDFKNRWEELSSVYEINLNPEKMKDTPLFVEAKYGKGRVFLSLIHFDTPNDKNGLKVFKNLKSLFKLSDKVFAEKSLKINQNQSLSIAKIMLNQIKDLIKFGERNFLWLKRNSFMYQWRRGIRGFEYINLYYMIKRINQELKESPCSDELISKQLNEVLPELEAFLSEARKLLLKERIALQRGKITYNLSDDEEIKTLRHKLFGESKSYGGLYKDLLKKIDEILFELLKNKLRVY